MVTVPSGATETKTLGLFTVPCGMPSAPHFGVSAPAAGIGNTRTASTRPPVESMPFSTRRRLTFSIPTEAASRICRVMSRFRSLLDCAANPLICAAAADVAEHCVVDVRVRGMRRLCQQRRGLHDLPGLAIAALRNVERAPRDLNRVIPVGIEPFDGGDRLAARVAHRHLA